jgi:hypothetical protein
LNIADGTRVVLEVDSGSDAHLRYQDVEANRRPNIDVRSGSVVFEFSPNWSSIGNGGSGPGGPGHFLSIGKWTDDAAVGCWNLSVNPVGSEVRLVTQSASFSTTNLVVPISLESNAWYQIALAYTSSNSIFYLNGAQIGAIGLGVTNYPGDLVRARYGINVGSNDNGTEQIRGRIDDFETFNYPLTAAEISIRPDTDSDHLPDGWEIFHGLDPYSSVEDDGGAGNPDEDALLNIEEWLLGSDPNSVEVPADGNGFIQLHTPFE